MKIVEALIKLKTKKCKDTNWHIVPSDEHDLCYEVLELAGKKLSHKNGFMNYGARYNDCIRVANALERDNRFRKTLVNHGTIRRMFIYIGDSFIKEDK